ncbi:hypothetical protein [Hymenobacter sp. YC55]|uniref:hypothetical protein n=1 Tax=Hymenobacter sp. YC55 TaxID=3034019 RepID=UPI0023F825F6|nr:hypothetical protein [Hymenobacter sp. YC55]MDF7815406.1 hypothetical protein [Hymenobacter sp. YC55]
MDRRLLLYFQQWHSPIADTLMSLLSSRGAWGPLALIIKWLLWRYGWRRVLPGMVAGMTGVLGANFVAGVLTPWVVHPRPCYVADSQPCCICPSGVVPASVFPPPTPPT